MSAFPQQSRDSNLTYSPLTKSRTPSFGNEEEQLSFMFGPDNSKLFSKDQLDESKRSEVSSSIYLFNQSHSNSQDLDANNLLKINKSGLGSISDSKFGFIEQIMKMTQLVIQDNKFLKVELNKMKQDNDEFKKNIKDLLEFKEDSIEKTRTLEFEVIVLKKQMTKIYEDQQEYRDRLKEMSVTLDRSQKDWVSVQDNTRALKTLFTQSNNIRKSYTKSPHIFYNSPNTEIESQFSSVKKAMDFKDFTAKKRKLSMNQEFFSEMKESIINRTGPISTSGKYLPEKLFDDFFVATVPIEAIVEHRKEFPTQTNFKLPGKIIWNLNGPESLEEPPKNCIQDFVFPFDINIVELTKEPEIHQLVKKVVTGEKKYGKRFMLQFLPGDDLLLLEWDPKIELININHFQYYVGFHHKDFVTIENEQGKTLFYQVNTAIFFKTFYPITPLFFNLVNSIMDHQKYQRQKLYNSDPEDLGRIDFIKSIEMYKYSLRRALIKIQEKSFDFSKKMDFNLDLESQKSQLISFTPPPIEEIFTLESLWNAHLAFTHLALEDLYFLFSAVILERKLIFVSKNISLLTGMISIFITLIKPISYTHPVLSLVPEELLDWCDMPCPALLGLNQTEDYVRDNSIMKAYPNAIYIFLDSRKIFSPEKFPILKKDTFFKEEDQRLKSIYQSFGDLRPMIIFDDPHEFENDNSRIEDLNSSPWEKQSDIGTGKKIFQSQAVFLIFKNFIEKILLKEVSKYPWSKSLTKDYQEIFDALKTLMMKGLDKHFLKEFIGTRGFAFYVQNYHSHKMSQITKI